MFRSTVTGTVLGLSVCAAGVGEAEARTVHFTGTVIENLDGYLEGYGFGELVGTRVEGFISYAEGALGTPSEEAEGVVLYETPVSFQIRLGDITTFHDGVDIPTDPEFIRLSNIFSSSTRVEHLGSVRDTADLIIDDDFHRQILFSFQVSTLDPLPATLPAFGPGDFLPGSRGEIGHMGWAVGCSRSTSTALRSSPRRAPRCSAWRRPLSQPRDAVGCDVTG